MSTKSAGCPGTTNWSCACNDRCPVCNKEIEANKVFDLTAIIEFDSTAGEWIVSVSSPEAEHGPDYRESRFKDERDARAFCASSRWVIDLSTVI